MGLDDTVTLSKAEHQRMMDVIDASRAMCHAIEHNSENLYPHIERIVGSLYVFYNPDKPPMGQRVN